MFLDYRCSRETNLFEGYFVTESLSENVPIIQKRSEALSMYCDCHINFYTQNAKDN